MFQPLLACVPDILDVESGNKPTITIPLTQDGERFAFVEIRLWPKDWGNGDYVDEIEFLITVFDERVGDAEEIWDRDLASGYVESVRPLVMKCVCRAAKVLVGMVQPKIIAMRTWAERPHPKSLCKYDLITDMLDTDFGYEITAQGYGPTSRWFWRFEKAGDA